MEKKIEKFDEYTVYFVKNQKGNRPVCRINGIVSFIDKKFKDFVEVGSSWIVQVTEVKSKNLVVYPLIILKTRKENELIVDNALNRFKSDKPRRCKKTNFYI